MKKIAIVLTALSILTYACNNSQKDSVEKADSINEARQDSPATSQPVSVDAESSAFLVKASDGGMLEVELGRLAQEKANHTDVKSFGNMMVSDHSGANEKIKNLASIRNVALPGTISDENQKLKDDLSKKSGRDFDRAYIKAMIDDHETDIREFEKAMDNVKDTEVKQFIDATLPTLRTHLDSAKAIQKRLK